jgi:raffinose/stachyose/melibiose transport system substrate-binding protein
LQPPSTFDEFIEVLDKLQAAGYEYPLMEGLSDAWAVSHYLGTIFQRLLDPALLEKDYNPASGEFTDPSYVDAMEVFKTLTDYMGELATAIDHETSRNMFVNGEVPIIYMQFAEIIYVEQAGMTDFAFFDFPKFKNGKGDPNALTGAPEGFMLSKNAPKEAEEFLKFITSKEIATRFTKDCGQLNAIKGAVTVENTSSQYLDAYDVILNASETTPWFDNAVNISIADAFMRGGQSLAIGDMTAEEVLDRVQEEATKLRNASN